MSLEKLAIFMGQEYGFIFTVAAFVIGVIGLFVSFFAIGSNHKKAKTILIVLTSLVIIVCIITVISFFVYKNSDASGGENESSNSISQSSTTFNSSSTDSIVQSSTTSDSSSTDSIAQSFTTSDSSSTDQPSSNLPTINPTSSKLYAQPSPDTDKWGYTDGNGTVVIPYIYDWADDFIDGYAAVCMHNNWGFIDIRGKEVIPFEYDGGWSFINGLAPVFVDGLWGFIDESGNVKIPFKFTNISRAYKGHEQVYLDENGNTINYENEINNSSSNSGTSSSTNPITSNTITPSDSPDTTAISVPIRESLTSNVSAYRIGSNMTIMVNKQLPKSLNKNMSYPFKWGFHLKDSLGNDNVGDYIIELLVCVDKNGTVIDTEFCVLLATNIYTTEVVERYTNKVSVDFDGENYVITCDIANEYITPTKICVNTNVVYEYRANGGVNMKTFNHMVKSKYHRQTPIREFSEHQTMYDLVMGNNADDMDMPYSIYLGKTRTFSQLRQETDALAAALYHDGVRKNSVVGVCLLTVPEVDTVLLAVNKIGAISFWLDGSLKPTDMLHYLETRQLSILIVHEALLPTIAQIAPILQFKRIIVVPADKALGLPDIIGSVSDPHLISMSEYIQGEFTEELIPAAYEEGKPSVIVQSSGSTGMPKSIVHTDYNFNAAIKKMAYCDLPFYKGERALVCAPPWIIYGLVNSIYSGLVLGCVTVFTTQPAEDMIYRHLEQFDFVYGVPVYIRYLYNKIQELAVGGDEAKNELEKIYSALRKVSVFISGGDKIAEEELISWQVCFDLPIINGYGNNEVTGAAVVSPRLANRPGSIGIPMFGTIAKTFDPDSGQMLPDGELGELYLGGDTVFNEYLGDPVSTQKIKTVYDGIEWVHTGDLAQIDTDGFIFLKGRTRRLIIDKLGYKISPDNCENYIQSFPFVRECVVVGVQIAKNDAVPMAFIELEEQGMDKETALETIKMSCREKLKDYECPKFFEAIEKIPHKENGGKQDFLALEKMAMDIVTSHKS